MEDTTFIIWVNGKRIEYFETDEETVKTVSVAIINDTLCIDKSGD